jgi:hypothetical protein
MPSSTPFVSPEFAVAGVAFNGKTEHGHVYCGAVVKLQLYGDMVCPVELAAPLTVAVYCVPYASADEGVNVAVVVVLE